MFDEAYVKTLREEAAANRTKARDAETAAEARINKILEAAGIKTAEEPLDASKLSADLAAEREAKVSTARELAIFRAASASGADPAKLLDSNSFMTSVKGLDPSDGEAVAAAITAAVTANQSLKAARAAGASGIELSGGTGEQGQITEQQLKTMSPEQIVEAQAKGQLRNLLG
jgi:hypothetical protein